MNQSEEPFYRFEEVEIDVLLGRLFRNGVEHHLRPKTFQVLVYLIENRAGNVSKNQLLNDIWKDIAVVDDVLVQSIKDIRRALGDAPHRPRFIKTIPKVGYRFIGTLEEGKRTPVSEEKSPGSQTETSSALKKPFPIGKNRFIFISVLLLVVLTLALGFAGRNIWQERQETSVFSLPNAPGRQTLAIMFFENHSNDADLDWLREGLTDMLISDLSQSEKITVLSRGQLHLLLERTKNDSREKIDLEEALEISRRTRAETFITGSFARLGEKVRIEVQLYNTESGGLLAAESLIVDNPEQILTRIDLLSLKLASRLGATGENNHAPKSHGLADVMTDNLEAYRYYSLAVEKAQALHNKEAIALLEKATALDPDFAMAHARIGYAYAVTWGRAAEGKPHLERAFQLSRRLSEKDRLSVAAWYAIANLDYPAAIPVYREIISKFPTESEAYWRLGRLLLGEEQYDEAIRVLRQGLAIDPDSKDIYNALSVTYRDIYKHDEAISMAERYVLLAPGEPNAYDSLALAYQAAGRYEEAEAAYKQALVLDPKFDVAVLHLGNLYFQMGRYSRAVESYENYIFLADSDWDKAWGWGRLAWVNLRWKKLPKAAAAAEKELKLDSGSFAGSLMVALEGGKSEKAARLRRRLYETSVYTERGLRPSLRSFYYLRGYSALKDKRIDEALENFRQLLKHRPMIWDVDSFEDCLANAYLILDKFDEAIGEYERILKLNPNYPLARFHLAQAYQRKGMKSQAQQEYRIFLETWKNADPDIPEVITARNFLAKS